MTSCINFHFTPAPLWRRLAAIIYDSFLVLALIWTTSAVYYTFINIVVLKLEEAPIGFNPLLSTLLTFTTFWFFAYFWTKCGQTLGMKVWQIRIQQPCGRNITLWQALLRFMVAIPSLGIGFVGVLWMKLDHDKQTWQDRYSMTQTVFIQKTGVKSQIL